MGEWWGDAKSGSRKQGQMWGEGVGLGFGHAVGSRNS